MNRARGGSKRATRLCVIPARGGSKRFPRKNVAKFAGRPLLAHAVGVAKSSGVFDRVLVSTEDAEIARIAARAGAEVHHRDARLAADGARIIDVCLSILDELEADGHRYDALSVLLPTSPFRTARHVRESLRVLERPGVEVVMSVVPYPHVPWWAVREERGRLALAFGPDVLKSRDKLPVLYRHNGVVLWARPAALRRHRDFYGPRVAPYHMTEEESVDIDHPIDLAFAEFLRRRHA